MLQAAHGEGVITDRALVQSKDWSRLTFLTIVLPLSLHLLCTLMTCHLQFMIWK